MGSSSDNSEQFSREFLAALNAATAQQVELAGDFGGMVGGTVHVGTGGDGHGDVTPAVSPSAEELAGVEIEGPPRGPAPRTWVL